MGVYFHQKDISIKSCVPKWICSILFLLIFSPNFPIVCSQTTNESSTNVPEKFNENTTSTFEPRTNQSPMDTTYTTDITTILTMDPLLSSNSSFTPESRSKKNLSDALNVTSMTSIVDTSTSLKSILQKNGHGSSLLDVPNLQELEPFDYHRLITDDTWLENRIRNNEISESSTNVICNADNTGLQALLTSKKHTTGDDMHEKYRAGSSSSADVSKTSSRERGANFKGKLEPDDPKSQVEIFALGKDGKPISGSISPKMKKVTPKKTEDEESVAKMILNRGSDSSSSSEDFDSSNDKEIKPYKLTTARSSPAMSNEESSSKLKMQESAPGSSSEMSDEKPSSKPYKQESPGSSSEMFDEESPSKLRKQESVPGSSSKASEDTTPVSTKYPQNPTARADKPDILIYETTTPDDISSTENRKPVSKDSKDTPSRQLQPANSTQERGKVLHKFKCMSKYITLNDVVCVCNKTYCDKLFTEGIFNRDFEWYTSSSTVHRFQRMLFARMSRYTESIPGAFHIDTNTKFQKILGFGGGFTDSACKNIQELSPKTRKHLFESYFGNLGLQYELGRVPIGGSAFSPRFYTYMDTPQVFMLSEQDFKYKIPVIREAIEITHSKLKLFGVSWSAPKWMKTQCSTHTGELKRAYYDLYADYHMKFLDEYSKNGIKFWALSPGNKPLAPFNQTEPPYANAMEWSPYAQSKWISMYLLPTLRRHNYHHIKLIVGEENRGVLTYFLKWFFEPLLGEGQYYLNKSIVSEVYFNVDGIGVHGYQDDFESIAYLEKIRQFYPDKFIIHTQTSCDGKPKLGSWACAKRYAIQMLNALQDWAVGWIDWNMALDQEGGPTYLNLFHDAAIIVNLEKDEFYKQPTYYVMAHFSKFLIPDSVRVQVTPFNTTSIAAIAAKRPDNKTVVVFYNRGPKTQNVTFVVDKTYQLTLDAPAESINTIVFK